MMCRECGRSAAGGVAAHGRCLASPPHHLPRQRDRPLQKPAIPLGALLSLPTDMAGQMMRQSYCVLVRT